MSDQVANAGDAVASGSDDSASDADGKGIQLNLPRALLIVLGLASGFVIVAGTRDLRDIIAPVFFALNLVLAASPLASWLTKHGAPRWLGATAGGLLVVVFLGAFVYSLVWSMASLISELPKYEDQFEGLYNKAVNWLDSIGITTTQIADQLQSINPQSIVSTATGLLSSLTSAGSLLIVLLTATFFLVVDSVSFDRRLKIADHFHPRITEALVAFAIGVRRYWVVTTIFGLIVAVLNVGLLVVLAVPLAIVWGVFSFITNYIPNVGFILGLIPPVLMALLANGPTTALIVLVGFSLLNFVIQSLIQPKFTGDAVGVTATVSFISLLFWSYVLGPLGALLALPATLLVKAILVDADPKARWVNAFIASDPETAEADSAAESVSDEPNPKHHHKPGKLGPSRSHTRHHGKAAGPSGSADSPSDQSGTGSDPASGSDSSGS